MKKSSKTSSHLNDKSSSTGDDALTLETGTGSVVTHGVSTDTFTRSIPTHIIPHFVRDVLFQAWPGMDGRRMDLTSSYLPWYAYNDDGTVDSVAHRLVVNTQDAENWGNNQQTNAFANYADVPFNPASVARWSFWRFDPLASELDPHMALEPQAYALDAFSQLFTESAAFHFGYLADIDREYHRLRALGPLGRLDEESSEQEAWYNLYHYWRSQLEEAYLDEDDGLVRLPQHLRDGNWTIADVLAELHTMMTDGAGNLHSDLIITAKGFARGMSGITLGVQDDAAYHDSDGNVRFYHPYMQSTTSALSIPSATYNAPGFEAVIEEADELPQFLYMPDDVPSQAFSVRPGTIGTSNPSLAGLWDFYAAQTSHYASATGWQTWSNANNANSTPWVYAPDNVTQNGSVLSDFMSIRDLPSNGILENLRYWSGHTLNFGQLVLFAREIGQSIEPQVLDTLIYPMGVIGDAGMFVRKPAGATVRHMDEIYNLYESTSSFNENPARLYTAAHLGPTSHMLASGDLNLRGMPIVTELNGDVVTAKERYWTPSLLTSGEAGHIASAFFPGAVLDVSLFRQLDLEAMAQFDHPALRALVARMLGNVRSMRTKVEKPIYLPAGKSGPEAVYASGLGMGAIQMVLEMVNALGGAAPRYGLGHGGFTDIRAEVNSVYGATTVTPINRASAALHGGGLNTIVMMPAGAEEDGHLLSLMLPQGSVAMDEFDVATPTLSSPLGQTQVHPASDDSETLIHAPSLSATQESFGIEQARGRGLFGGITTPLHTLRGSFTALPSTLTHGVYAVDGAADVSVDSLPAGTCSGTVAGSPAYARYDIYEFPSQVTVTRQVDGADVAFTVDLLDVPEVQTVQYEVVNAAGDVNVTSATNLPWDWERKYFSVRDSVQDERMIRVMNTNGTWKTGARAMFSETAAASDAAFTRTYVPDKSLTEIVVAALNAGNAIHGDTTGWSSDISDWSEIRVRTVTGTILGQGYAGQTRTFAWSSSSAAFLDPLINIGSTESMSILSIVDLGLVAGDATESQLNSNLLPDALVNVTSEHSATGMSTFNAKLEVLHQAGLQFAYTGSEQDPTFTNAPGFTSKRVPIANNGILAVSGAKVYGVDPTSTRSTMGGTWATPVVNFVDPRPSEITASPSPLPYTEPSTNASWADPVEVENVWTRIVKGGANGMSALTAAQAEGWSPGYTTLHAADGVFKRQYYSIAFAPSFRDSASGLGAAAHESGAQLTFIYPDDPKYKMMYRPWRVIADASILKELRMLFANDGEDVSLNGGPLGIKVIGTAGQFRFADLLDAGQPETFILEPSSSKTRLISPSFRSVLTFTKLGLLDPQTQRHAIPDEIDTINQGLIGKGAMHKGDVGGSPVLTRELIREVQLGRQRQRL